MNDRLDELAKGLEFVWLPKGVAEAVTGRRKLANQEFKGLEDLLILLACLALISFAQAAPGDVDLTFDAGAGGLNGAVHMVVPQADGKIIIIGEFSTVRAAVRYWIARLNADGTVDRTFDPGREVNGSVVTAAVQTDGKVLVGGSFTIAGGASRNGIARLNADGSLDRTFDPGTGADDAVFSIALQTDAKVLIAGRFTTINGTSRNYIARLNADGSLDGTFNPGAGADLYVLSVAVQADGKVVVAGIFTRIDGSSRNGIARLNADGSVDNTFDPGIGIGANNIVVSSIALQTDGKMLAVGSLFDKNIARLNADGSLDSTFDPGIGANGSVDTVAQQTDGKVLVGGGFTTINGTNRNRIARLNADGRLDNTFNPGANDRVLALAVQTDGQVLVGGDFNTVHGISRDYFARLKADGSLDDKFNPSTGANGSVFCVAVQADGKILAGGEFTTINGISHNRIARLNSDGSLDDTFNPGTGADFHVITVALQPDGKVVAGGYFSTINGTSRNRIARLNADGTLDSTFHPGTGADDYVRSVALQTDGKVLVAGDFTRIDGTSRNQIARLNVDGSVDLTFDAGSGGQRSFYALALQADGKVLVGGNFTSINGMSRNSIARLNMNGNLDSTFNPGAGADRPVHCIAVQTDGKVLIGGAFTSTNGSGRNSIARLNNDGSLDSNFVAGTGENSAVDSMVVQPDGKVLVGGYFSSINDVSRNGIARLNADGSLDSTFDPGTGVESGPVDSIAVQPDGKVVVGGYFITVNGKARAYVARFFGDPAAVSPIPLTVQKANNQVVLNWANAAFSLQSAPSVTGTYSNVLGAASPYTNSITGAQQYFRLKAN